MKGYPTIFNGIIFIETPVDEGERVAPVNVDLSFKIGAQLKNLNDVKNDLANLARNYYCNCVSEFKYGQKSRWLAIDDVAFFGNGVAVRLPPESYQRIVEYIQQRDGT